MLHDMLMLGSGHSEEEGSVDHALMLLEFMMRQTEFALMFTQQVSSPFSPPIHTRCIVIPSCRLDSLVSLHCCCRLLLHNPQHAGRS